MFLSLQLLNHSQTKNFKRSNMLKSIVIIVLKPGQYILYMKYIIDEVHYPDQKSSYQLRQMILHQNHKQYPDPYLWLLE